MGKYIPSGEGYFVQKDNPSIGCYGISPEIDKERNEEWKRKSFLKDREINSEKEILERIYNFFIGRGRRIKNHPVLVKGLFGKLKDEIVTTENSVIRIKKMDGENLEKYVLNQFKKYNLEIPEDYFV